MTLREFKNFHDGAIFIGYFDKDAQYHLDYYQKKHWPKKFMNCEIHNIEPSKSGVFYVRIDPYAVSFGGVMKK